MSHQPERKDKNCLNCGTEVQGRFCHVCGQENVVTHQNFWSLTRHFIFDIFHFDGKFFDTLKYLLIKPGFVAKEYVKGKRMSYLDPIRMYLFTSAVFFLIFFKFMNTDKIHLNDKHAQLSNVERIHFIDSLQSVLGHTMKDSVKIRKLELLKDTSLPFTANDLNFLDAPEIMSHNNKYHTVEEYESYQKSLPEKERDNWMERMLAKKSLSINKKYEGNKTELVKDFIESFLHRLPIMLFFSLPFFALILKMLYSRRKNFFYSDHAVFTLYQYIFSFILLLFLFGFSKLEDLSGWSVFSWLLTFGIIYGGYYLLRSLKLFYGQGWGKTTTKFLLLNFLGGITVVLLFLVFFLLSIFEF